ncbi:MAG: sugar phosphate isomerase/epimerase family protein [Candidatus Acidiferrales bacterium]
MNSPFRVSVISDEITQDFGHACEVVSTEFGLDWIELRTMWNKNILALDANEIAEARKTLESFNLRVTNIASPLFKVDWPGAPKSEFSPKNPTYNSDYTFDQQDEVLERSIELARVFNTDRVRGFDFWRLADPAPYRAAMDVKLRDTAEKIGKQNMIFLLENEPSCNTATGAEAARTLAAVTTPTLMLNWDPGNAVMDGEIPFPGGWQLLPHERIGHCHVKDCKKKADGSGFEWALMGTGLVDWVGQFRALMQMGYHYATSLETHWHGGGTPEQSTRMCWAVMKDDLRNAGALS